MCFVSFSLPIPVPLELTTDGVNTQCNLCHDSFCVCMLCHLAVYSSYTLELLRNDEQ